MKPYPKIPNSKEFPLEQCFAFEKYDGSNLRWEWSKKKGFYKYGTRRRLFDKTDPDFGCAIDIFMQTYGTSLTQLFVNHPRFAKAEGITVFTEFFGPNSFAGLHLPNDPKEVVLFDIWIYKHGLIGPEEFVKITKDNNIKAAKVVYNGKFSGRFAEDVRTGKYNVKEGVICKLGTGGRDLTMCKIKTYAYLEKLKAVFHDKWMEFWE